ncbi:DoxX family protein [Fulvivirgaceae bacterium BMA12]|uniref:DoxX family protein n=1 Tax=Agaribacillus aureus TaxID=3051825 RepID=A0ABT8L1I9_9BACT|nr:DoxX family protein [Fulvivirgaceae bacterium BMA12]
MNALNKIENWGNTHRLSFFVIFRVFLGVFITYKGLIFMFNINDLQNLAGQPGLIVYSTAIAHYVIFAHVLGGPLIALGLYTRWVSLIQIPILIGAVVLVNYPKAFLSVGQFMELEMSIIVLVLLVMFLIFGAGKFSLDQIRRDQMQQKNQ